MNGVHDIGGMDGIGELGDLTLNEQGFHEDWHKQTFSLIIAIIAAGYMKIDEVRRETETMLAQDYLSATYYERWVYVMERLMVEKKALTWEEINTRKSLGENETVLPAAPTEVLNFIMTAPLPVRQELDTTLKFKDGEHIITKNNHPLHHTRIPRYARGKRGVIMRYQGAFLLPDSNAYGEEKPEHNYSVKFSARELWGDDGGANDFVYLDLFDSYMDAA